jgi:hypothetical protein
VGKKKSSYKGGWKDRKKQIELKLTPSAEAWIAFQDANLLPLEEFTNTNQKWKSQCLECGEIVEPRIADIKGGRGGCRFCRTKKSNKKRFPNQSDKALVVARKSNLEPLEPYKNANTQWKCKCLKCREIVTPLYANLKKGHGGCLYCQKSAFKLDKPAYLYFIHHKHMQAFKIGIGNYDSVNDRLKSFIKVGWHVLNLYNFKYGKDAIKVEKAVFKWLRKDLNIPVFLSDEQFSHGGSSETFSDISIPAKDINNKLNSLTKGYRNNP